MTQIHGADPDALNRSAAEFRACASELEANAAALTFTVRGVGWTGGLATDFVNNWEWRRQPHMRSMASFLREAADQLDRNAADQMRASSVSASPRLALVHVQMVGNSAEDLSIELQNILEAVGAAHSDVSKIAEIAELLSDNGAVGALVEFLTDPAFKAVLDGVSVAVDVGDVVVDFIEDFAEHGELSTDERIVHAVTDVAVVFGLNEGIDAGSKFLTAALVAAVLPGVGVAAGWVAGQIVSEVLSGVTTKLIDGLDEATDFVDEVADRAVDVYSAIRVVVDVLGEISVADLMDDARDLSVSVGKAIIDLHLGRSTDLVSETVGLAGRVLGL